MDVQKKWTNVQQIDNNYKHKHINKGYKRTIYVLNPSQVT
jgi:hypothetical protein